MSGTILDVVRSAAQVEDVRDAVRWAQDAHKPGRLEELVEFVANRYGDYARAWCPPPARTSGLRPYVPVAVPEYQRPSISYPAPELRPTAVALEMGFGNFGYELLPGSTERLVRRLKHQLLYCEALAIDNPLGPTNEQWFGSTSGVGFGRAQGEAVGRYIGLLADLEPLVASDALVLVEHPFGIDPQDDRLPAAVERAHALGAEVSERTRPSPGALWLGDASAEELAFSAEVVDMARCLSVCGRTGTLAPYAAGERQQRALEEAERICWQIVTEQTGWPEHIPAPAAGVQEERRRLETLLRLRLPDLDGLALTDIALVRDEGEFEGLRRHVAAGLDAVIAEVDDDDPDWAAKAQRVLEAQLAEPRERVNEAVYKSQALRAAVRPAPRDFALGIAGIGPGVGFMHDLLSGQDVETILVGLAGEAAVAGALTACWRGFRTWREERRDPSAPRDLPKLAAYRHLCVLAPPAGSWS